jgi:hypothetical protein
MTVNASIAWDEENNPRPFLFCWAIAAVFCVLLLLAKLSAHPSTGLKGLTVFLVVLPAVFYVNLVMNCIWRKNPYYTGYAEDASQEAEAEDAPVSLFATPKAEKEPMKPTREIFSQFSLDAAEPVLTRDPIQWGRMLLATAAMAALIASLVFSL